MQLMVHTLWMFSAIFSHQTNLKNLFYPDQIKK